MTPVQFFKCLADDTRLRCVMLLHRQGKLCVCELTAALAMSQPKISRHLAQLRQCGLLIDSREGQWVYYQINPTLPSWVFPTLTNVFSAIEHSDTFKRDLARLRQMKNQSELEVYC